jgi:hydrogenase maturation protein HypF
VSSLLGIRHEITYEAQAAIELEHLAASGDGSRRRLRSPLRSDGRIEVRDIVTALVDGLDAGESAADLAASFHEATVEMVVAVAERARAARGIEVVGLTGGVFQNALLTEAAAARLDAEGFDVLLHRLVPPNDGGLALGQALVAAPRR